MNRLVDIDKKRWVCPGVSSATDGDASLMTWSV